MKIIVINGAPGVGKDEFVKQCQKLTLWCKNVSTVDFVKDVAKYCGWKGDKTPENRAFLSDLKQLLGDWNDIPYKKTLDSIYAYEASALSYDFSTDDVIVFVHCREPKEITRFVKDLNAITLFITREDVVKVTSNKSDVNVAKYSYDYVIHNNGTIEDLRIQASQFLERIGVSKIDFSVKKSYNQISN